MDSSTTRSEGIGSQNAGSDKHVPLLSRDGQSTSVGGGSGWSFRSNSMPRSLGSSKEGKPGQSSWARGFPSWASSPRDSESPGPKSGLNFFNNMGFGKQTAVKIPVVEAPIESTSGPASPGPQDGNAFNTFTKGFVTSGRNAVKAVQTKARHMVSQNKRRYQEGGFDLDMAYITENIIAMGFPAGDMSSGLLGYVEGFYRNHMEEVIKFFETKHKGKYKVYNLCSERLYDAALFEGKVACFPFDDHNCPQLQMIPAFCQSAYSWLKGDLENVVVVHCKAGMARTGLMICCLLLYLKFFPTSEESISHYNQKRCVDGKGLVLPSQLRYVKYFETVLRQFDGRVPTGRKCILRGIRLHRCPYWIRPSIVISDHSGVLFSTKKHPRTKEMMPEDIWFAAPRKGVMVFALPGERCIADLNGDFKVLFQDRHGDFYCWFNTNMMEMRQVLTTNDLDGFEKRRLPSPGFQVEVVILDHDAPLPSKPRVESPSISVTNVLVTPHSTTENGSVESNASRPTTDANELERKQKEDEQDNIFTDSEGEDDEKVKTKTLATSDVREEKCTVIGAGEVQAGTNLNTSSTFTMSSTIDGIRIAMDRMGISQVGWANVGGTAKPSSRPSSPAEDSSVGTKTVEEATLYEGQKTTIPARGMAVDHTMEGHENFQQGTAGDINVSRSEGQDQSSSESTFDTSGARENLGGAQNYAERDGLENMKIGQQIPTSRGEQSGMDAPDGPSDFKAIAAANAADASIFTFGDDEDDYDSDE